MIKKWNNFILENVDHYLNYYNNVKKKLDHILNTPDSEYENGVNGKRSDLIYIFENDLKLENNNVFSDNHIINVLNLYTEYVYNESSKEIRKFLTDTFGKVDKWSYIRDYTSILIKKNFKKFSEIILKMLDLYGQIKNDFDDNGYPKRSNLSEKIEYICINSLDQDIVEFFEVREEWNGVYVELGYDANLTVDKLHSVADELLPLKERIIEEEKLNHTELIFENQGNIIVIFE